MKKFITYSILAASTLIAIKSSAQSRIPVQISIDSSFGHFGKQEVLIGNVNDDVNDEVTDFSLVRSTLISTLCGKVGTATSGKYHLGMIRVDSSGNLDPSFGSGGIVNASWGESDYANSIQEYLDPSGTLILAGASGTNPTLLPSLYKFKKNGTPDSSFGTVGKLTMPFANHSYGEATHVDVSFGQYKISGKSIAADPSGVTGFGVMTFNADGTLDSTFGIKGRMVIPALVHSVHGFFMNDRRFFFCGISDTGKRELLLGRFTENGVPDSSVGVNGLIHTGIILTGDTVMAQFSPADSKIVILLLTPGSAPTHLTICRFTPYGVPDSMYSHDGISENDILPSFEPKGLYIGNDLSQTVSGMTKSGLGSSIFVRMNDTTASPDPIFNHTGIIPIDIDGGAYSNYLKFVEPIGKLNQSGSIKRFIGIGGSVQNGVGRFMITRLIGLPYSAVPEEKIMKDDAVSIYPNPAASKFKIQTSASVKNIRIVDAFGREVMRLDSENNGDARDISNGIYYCIVQSGAGQIIRKFIVAH